MTGKDLIDFIVRNELQERQFHMTDDGSEYLQVILENFIDNSDLVFRCSVSCELVPDLTDDSGIITPKYVSLEEIIKSK